MAKTKMYDLIEDIMETNVLVSIVSFVSYFITWVFLGSSHLWLVQKGYEFGFYSLEVLTFWIASLFAMGGYGGAFSNILGL